MVKFEADDPGSGTWDHVEETWEFTHEQVRSVDDFVDEHGYMNYKEKDGLKNLSSNTKTVSSSTENAGSFAYAASDILKKGAAIYEI